MAAIEKLMTVNSFGIALISNIYNHLEQDYAETSVERLQLWREELHECIWT